MKRHCDDTHPSVMTASTVCWELSQYTNGDVDTLGDLITLDLGAARDILQIILEGEDKLKAEIQFLKDCIELEREALEVATRKPEDLKSQIEGLNLESLGS